MIQTATQPTGTLEPTAKPFTSEFSENLRAETAAVRVMHRKFGTRKSLSRDQIALAASQFDADGDFVSASKRLIDTSDEAYKAVTQTISRARAYWKSMTVPFPIKGIRLLRKDLVPAFNEAMGKFRTELEESVESLETRFLALRTEAQSRLGNLFNPQDYPECIGELFHLQWDYPNVEPPNYLKELNPELYEQQSAMVSQRFEAALSLAEDAFTAELQGLVSHLVERLSDDSDSDKPKVFRNTAITNMTEFFERFQQMNIRSNSELNQLVEQAEKIVSGIDPKDLRKDLSLRKHISLEMEAVKSTLDSMVETGPDRMIELEESDAN